MIFGWACREDAVSIKVESTVAGDSKAWRWCCTTVTLELGRWWSQDAATTRGVSQSWKTSGFDMIETEEWSDRRC